MVNLEQFYNKNYKILWIIPVILLIASIIIIANFNAKTGDFLNKDTSLKGGISARVYLDREVDIIPLEDYLKDNFNSDATVRSLTAIEGAGSGFLIESGDMRAEDLKTILGDKLQIDLDENNFFIELTGSKLGDDFYKQMVRALIIAFVFMGIVIFITFRSFIPSVAVILSAFLDIVGTIAVLDILNVNISSAGVAALLLLVGYSVDTDVLLTTRVLKGREGTVWERIVSSIKTGLTMTITTLVTMIVGYTFTNSLVLRQMFSVIFIGLVIDVISTYFMNAGILKWYVTRRENG